MYYDGAKSTWVVTITINKRTQRVGSYATELEAAHAYDAASKELLGDSGVTNFFADGTRNVKW